MRLLTFHVFLGLLGVLSFPPLATLQTYFTSTHAFVKAAGFANLSTFHFACPLLIARSADKSALAKSLPPIKQTSPPWSPTARTVNKQSSGPYRTERPSKRLPVRTTAS